MDFTNRGSRQVQQNTQTADDGANNAPNEPKSGHRGSKPKFGSSKWGKIGYIGFLLALAVLVVAVLLSVVLHNGSSATKENQFVDRSKFQAVFLNGGQVYFGKIGDLNQKYMSVANIYYLRVNQQVQPGQENKVNDVSLVKLGCELHGPQDVMVINREQVIFWENLKDDGQVAKAIAEYVKANPNGQKCSQQQQNTNTNTNTDTTTPTPTPTPTTPRTNTGTTGR